MKNKYCVLDLETTSIHSYKRFANPFDKRNKIIVVATLVQDQDPELMYAVKGVKDYKLPIDNCSFIVGHNLKFDLSYLWDNEQLQQWIKDGGKVWDTMTAEYLLSGQYTTYPSLDELTEHYGGEQKDDRVTEKFKEGFGADEIDPDILLPYAEGDVINTETILLGQGKRAKTDGMLNIILAHMEHYLALCEMEYNGLHFNLTLAHKLKTECQTKVKELLEQLAKAARWCLNLDYNPDSDEHNSAVLFNTAVSIVEDVQLTDENGDYLTYGPKAQRAGQIKTRKEKIEHKNKGFGLDPEEYSRPLKKAGVYSTDHKVLKAISARWKDVRDNGGAAQDLANFCDLLLDYRETTKFLNTYLYGCQSEKEVKTYNPTLSRKDAVAMEKEIFLLNNLIKADPLNKDLRAKRATLNQQLYVEEIVRAETGLIPLVKKDTGCIHHTLDTVQTKTGRVNSKNPNGQNIPRDLLQLFDSRFGDDGVIVAIDYSQLEVRVQAYLAQSERMINDIKNNLDFHALRLSYAVDKPYESVVQLIEESEEWKLKRKKAKTISFEKAYGAAPQKIAQSTGLPVETVIKIFKKEDERYPEVKAFNDDVMAELKRNRIPTDKLIYIRDKITGDTITRPGYYQGIGYYQSITGKRYHFYERAVLNKFGQVYSYFSPPDVCNFPVQGLAADIVSMQVGRLFRYLINHRDKCLMVNEVHDEVVLDMKKEYMNELLPEIVRILEDVDGSFRKNFGCGFNVPIKVDVSYGANWGECK